MKTKITVFDSKDCLFFLVKKKLVHTGSMSANQSEKTVSQYECNSQYVNFTHAIKFIRRNDENPLSYQSNTFFEDFAPKQIYQGFFKICDHVLEILHQGTDSHHHSPCNSLTRSKSS